MQKQQEMLMRESTRSRIYGPVAYEYTAANTGSWRIERPQVNFEACSKCGTCARYCPTNVIDIMKELVECVVIDFDYCKGCGICANECPKKCISMVPERSEA